ncbi:MULTISPECIES: DUF3231 family protein [unclassified Paenibacillus]|uniref:DUF3231 family protein n=1 Tax=unclassified Paenibacillus TaxID=185978 RepID=UPI00104C5FE6|nr:MULTISPECIES: DUF3231 family protein [unclassified Paenibacillus]NIK69966.1 hypothetical protein [Paenibacillus sp. BK720]TCM97798.1 uncharacterized protein DUF3231 [Paenibacillus sp. BK033]
MSKLQHEEKTEMEGNTPNKLTSAEVGKLWATFMGNSMARCVLRYFQQNVDDADIRNVLNEALQLADRLTQTVKDIFTREGHPVPVGLTDDDVNLKAPRLYADEFYLHYLKYTGKAGISIYGIAVPLMSRQDIREFFTDCLKSTINLINDVNDLLDAKGLLVKPPYIPVPDKIDFIKKQRYLDGFFGDIRPLQSLEITHIYDNVQNNATSCAVLVGFCQAAKLDQVRNYFKRGKDIALKQYDILTKLLHKEDLPTHPLMNHLVTDSTVSPFSDKLMLTHKIDMFAMRVRTYGNALAFSARHDVSATFARLIMEVGNYVEDGANTMIDLGWMEQPPQAADRKSLTMG